MNREDLEDHLIAKTECTSTDAEAISERAVKLKERVESDPENWDSLEIDPGYIVSRIEMAPDHLSPTGKWDWWAGTMDYFGSKGEYKIN